PLHTQLHRSNRPRTPRRQNSHDSDLLFRRDRFRRLHHDASWLAWRIGPGMMCASDRASKVIATRVNGQRGRRRAKMRSNSMRWSHFFTVLLALTACGAQQTATMGAGDGGAPVGSSSGGAASSGGAGTSSGGVSSSSGGAGTGDGSSPIVGSLAGTWDLVGATPGAVPQMGTMILGTNVLTLTFIDVVLDFRGSGSTFTATYTHYSAAHV